MSIKNVSVGVWKVAVSVRVKSKPFPIKRKATVKGTKNAALLKEAELRKAALDEGQVDGESSLKIAKIASSTFSVNTLGDGIGLYVDRLRAKGEASKATQVQYGWLDRELGHAPILGLGETFGAWLKVYTTSLTRSGKPRNPSTVNRVISMVKAVCNHLVDLEILTKNPITKARCPLTTVKAREVYLSPEERDRLLGVIHKEKPFLEPIVRFMLAVPCRAFSELVGAKREQLRGNMIFIPKSKNGDALYKPIPSNMVDYFNSIPDGCPYLFYRKVGETYLPLSNLAEVWKTVRKRAGLPNLRIHDLRHVAVTDLITRGVPTHVLMKVAGWRSDMTRTYFNMAAKGGAEFVLDMEKAAIRLAS
jgi:integrase